MKASSLSSGQFRKRRTRATNSSTSASAKALPSESIDTAWRTLPKLSEGLAPTEALAGPVPAWLSRATWPLRAPRAALVHRNHMALL